MKMSRGKRNVLFAGVLSCAMLFGIGNTMAYFTENSVQTNVFTTGDLDIGLKEPDWDPNENDGKNMYPGYTVYKNPTVKNITSDKNGDEPCYVRMSVDTARSTASKLVFNYMGAKGDGILNIGEESTLFTNIAIPTDWNQTQMQKVGNYQLKVTAQAIQSKGFATQSEAYRMLDEEIKGGTLQEINRGSEN